MTRKRRLSGRSGDEDDFSGYTFETASIHYRPLIEPDGLRDLVEKHVVVKIAPEMVGGLILRGRIFPCGDHYTLGYDASRHSLVEKGVLRPNALGELSSPLDASLIAALGRLPSRFAGSSIPSYCFEERPLALLTVEEFERRCGLPSTGFAGHEIDDKWYIEEFFDLGKNTRPIPDVTGEMVLRGQVYVPIAPSKS